MSGADQKLLGLSQLREGHYVFKLTVYDTKGLTGTDTVSVNVKRGKNGESKIGLLSCIKEEQSQLDHEVLTALLYIVVLMLISQV